MNKTVILNLQNLRDNLTDEQVVNHVRRLMHRTLTVDVRIADEPSVAKKPAWLKGDSDVEWSYNVIAEWLSSGIMQAVTKPDRDGLAVLQALIYAALTTARQAGAQDAYEQAAVIAEGELLVWGLDEPSQQDRIAAKIRALAAAEAEGKK